MTKKVCSSVCLATRWQDHRRNSINGALYQHNEGSYADTEAIAGPSQLEGIFEQKRGCESGVNKQDGMKETAA